MSITISNWQQIRNAPTNRSLSKMTYSFPRAGRFSSQKHARQKCGVYYDIGLMGRKNVRATSFGYGQKYDFTHDMPVTPPPGSYQSPSEFDVKVKKGYCFGEGREEMTVTGPLAEMINNKNPGPGSYEPMKKGSKVAFSIRGKIKDPVTQAEKVPGPGTYANENFFNEAGTNFNSKFKTHRAAKFSSGDYRFKFKESIAPGPGQYSNCSTELSPTGKYTISNLHNSMARSFGSSKRKPINARCQTPGPGNYTLPSEFGHYLDKRQFQKSRKVEHQAV